jgi:hypothetical protein
MFILVYACVRIYLYDSSCVLPKCVHMFMATHMRRLIDSSCMYICIYIHLYIIYICIYTSRLYTCIYIYYIYIYIYIYGPTEGGEIESGSEKYTQVYERVLCGRPYMILAASAGLSSAQQEVCGLVQMSTIGMICKICMTSDSLQSGRNEYD